MFRNNKLEEPTIGMALGYIQVNLAMFPSKYFSAFQEFSRKNIKSCPLIEITNPGECRLKKLAKNCDLRTDIPRYSIYQYGKLIEEQPDILKWYREDLVSFLLGSAVSVDEILLKENIHLKHVDGKRNVALFNTNIRCKPVYPFNGNITVAMRPIASKDIEKVYELSEKYVFANGKPLHFGEPEKIGIKDISKPDYGDPIRIKQDETPVFWSCGVTVHAVIAQSGLEFAITHSPGYLLITDIKCSDII